MKHISEVVEIIEAGINGNSQKITNYAELLALKLEKESENKDAARIRKVLTKSKSMSMTSKNLILKEIPVDSESRLPLAEIEEFGEEEIMLIQPPFIKQQIDGYIDVIKRRDELISKGLKSHRNLLLSGLPGTGKSQTAKYIAAKSHMPLVTVRIDGLISSFLGSTSKNIKILFDYVNNQPCILFLDEFDAFAKMRDDVHELGELKRVVNTLLQNIDSLKKPIIAATNHEHLLDPAVWRRFDYKIKLELPSERSREELLKIYMDKEEVYQKNKKVILALTEKWSGSEIEHFCEAIKTSIALSTNKFSMKNLFDIYTRFVMGIDRLSIGEVDPSIIVARTLRQKSDVFDFRTLSNLTGISKSKLHRILQEGKKNE
ncbi:ATP-binding protein [Candidatus Woesearchaeota archaeon]|nr:ATP-binding protein [Candidatus Woesearchaeota archaeon]